MKKLLKLGNDFVGLLGVCGPIVAFRWIFQVLFHIREIVDRGDLQAADAAMGEGPFNVTLRKYKCKFNIVGPHATSGIREMYVRDVYLRDGWLSISAGNTVVDLGANMGNFTNLALAIDESVHVIAVEPSKSLNQIFYQSVGLNAGHLDRTVLIRGFLGQVGEKQKEIILNDENYAHAEWLTEEELIRRADLKHIDFLKCDIEGGEFGLLTPNSKLLAMTEALACEVHAFAGDVTKFLFDVESCGFVMGPIQHDPDGSVTFLAKRSECLRSGVVAV
jgi:FkbM family methyltransferase